MPLIINQGDNLSAMNKDEKLPTDAMIADLAKLEAWLSDGSFYSDYDESLRLLGVFRRYLAMNAARTPDTETLSTRDRELVERLRKPFTAWNPASKEYRFAVIEIQAERKAAADRLEALLSTRDDVVARAEQQCELYGLPPLTKEEKRELTDAEAARTIPIADEGLTNANHDCLAKAKPGEPMFIILGRDPDGGNIVRLWAQRRLDAGDADHAIPVLDIADAMDAWRAAGNLPESAPDPSDYAPMATPINSEPLYSGYLDMDEEHTRVPQIADSEGLDIWKALSKFQTEDGTWLGIGKTDFLKALASSLPLRGGK